MLAALVDGAACDGSGVAVAPVVSSTRAGAVSMRCPDEISSA